MIGSDGTSKEDQFKEDSKGDPGKYDVIHCIICRLLREND